MVFLLAFVFDMKNDTTEAGLDRILGLSPFFFSMQILNLTQALKDNKSPLHLVQMPPVIVETARSHQRSASESYTQSFQSRKPFFSWW